MTLEERMREIERKLRDTVRLAYGSEYFEGYGRALQKAADMIASALQAEKEQSDGQ